MELEVLETKGLPPGSVLSISAGGTRRQVQVSALDRPLKFPGNAGDISQVKVDVLDVKGRARLPFDSKKDAEKVSVQLESTAETADANVPAAPESMEVVLKMKASDVPVSPQAEEADAGMRRRKELEANGYLEEHGLVPFMQFLLHTLLQDKPRDPYQFLQKQVGLKMSAVTVPSSSDPPAEKPPLPAPTGQELEQVNNLLDRLTPRRLAETATEEDMAALEREALEASERLREDNAKLRATALELKKEYEKLMQESALLHRKLDEKRARKKAMAESLRRPTIAPFPQYYQRFVGRQCSARYWNTLHGSFSSSKDTAPAKAVEPSKEEPSTQVAFREIQKLQEEVMSLARENAKLVADLSRGREMIDMVRKDIMEIRSTIQD